MEIKTEAVVLRKMEVGEHDQLVFCFTREMGKICARAVGINKMTSKQKNHLDLLDYSDFILIFGKNNTYIKSAASISKYYELKSNILKNICALLMLEMVDKSTALFNPEPKVFELLVNTLNLLIKIKQKSSVGLFLALERYFLENLLKIQGYGQNQYFFRANRLKPTLFFNQFNNLFEDKFYNRLNSLEVLRQIWR